MSCYALVDCNNFYASCERVFQPALTGRPVVVLSNNDGCIIARSDEAKALGIPMGAPLHEYAPLLKRQKVAVFSSNYALYGDISARVMDQLTFFTPDVEVYSIDEAFLGLDGFTPAMLPDHMRQLRRSIRQWTGIPVSVGVAPTKTLAKLANRIAKKYTSDGVYVMDDPELMTRILGDIEVEDIWGISKRWGARLRRMGIGTALQLRQASPRQIRQALSVVGERIVHELNGRSCLALEEIQPRKTIMSSRSFGTMISNRSDLEEAVASYTARAAEKLRRQRSRAGGIYVFIRTNRFRQQDPQYSNAAMVGMDEATSDTAKLIRAAMGALRHLWRAGYRYHKAGVMLTDLVDDHGDQASLFQTHLYTRGRDMAAERKTSDRRMAALDQINAAMGQGTLFHATEGLTPGGHHHREKRRHNLPKAERWRMRAQFKSPAYTTRWSDLVRVR